ncbi:MAG: NAD(P)/FAD-dependent oxidoreductase [Mycobacteriaceae bacterium]
MSAPHADADADVVVVGAGLAGLVCAKHLQACGLEVVVLESGDTVGGRVATDVVDGFTCDRGFQVLNTAYPALRREVHLPDLELAAFTPGAAVRTDDGALHRVVNPLRRPLSAPATALDRLLSPAEKLALVRWSVPIVLRAGARSLHRPDVTTAQALDDAGLGGSATEHFLRPFLAGVLLERDLETSARFAALVWRTFALGTVTVPAGGMAALPAHLAAQLTAGTVWLNTRVHAVSSASVRTGDGELSARSVVVATDPVTASELLGLPTPVMRSVTTHYHVADTAPTSEPLLHLDGTGGPLLNTVVMTAAAPSYSPDHRALISTSTLEPRPESLVREQAGRLYGVDPRGWTHLSSVHVDRALPALTPPTPDRLRRPVHLGGGLFVAGDHRDTPSLQGAMAGGRRAARAVHRHLQGR